MDNKKRNYSLSLTKNIVVGVALIFILKRVLVGPGPIEVS